MALINILLAAAFGVNLVAAQMQCNGYRLPAYDDCDTVISDFAMRDNEEVFHENGEDSIPQPSCKWWYKNDGNCRITHCYTMTNDAAGTVMKRTGSAIASDYDKVHDKCVSWRAGGTYTETFTITDVFNDEDQSTPALTDVSTSSSGVISGKTSLEAYYKWKAEHAPKNEPAEARQKARSIPAKMVERVRNQKRDGVKDDKEFNTPFSAIGVRNTGAVEYGPRLGTGVGYKYEVSESTKWSVSTSIELGGAWNIFTASMGITVSREDTFTVTEGLTFDVKCDKTGQVLFYPFYDYYQTQFFPSENWADIWVPVHSGKNINGEIAINCLG
ncbi:unnamed protein product [Clonostachys chloroleuca]|uniref:Uncharacterized protein n=1 Tax=Clonostachys chloroleuca TaxID=1926264 RepID=A0AA35VHR9_9HYPO|nr:unnamed protein product [Clonostachys chloroleuca]